MSGVAALLDELSQLSPKDFAQRAYETILGRAPTTEEASRMLEALLRGDTPTWLLGALRYGREGRSRAIEVPGLRARYLAQRAFRIPVLGALVQWLAALVRLPSSLRYFRAARQLDDWKQQDDRSRIEFVTERIDAMAAELRRLGAQIDAVYQQIEAAQRATRTIVDAELRSLQGDLSVATASLGEARTELHSLRGDVERAVQSAADDRSRTAGVEAALRNHAADAQARTEALANEVGAVRSRLDPILPSTLADSLEIEGTPLITMAREKSGIAANAALASLSSAERYALFEAVFYDPQTVSRKQRIYLPYLDRDLTRHFPFLDLGCGRGEFLRILAGEGIRAVGVDVNATSFPSLRDEGIDVVEGNLLAFLEADSRVYSGASMLQVAEHLDHETLERALALVAQRLAPGAIFILETPNPLSPFALSHFHTDHTHVAPLPPEAIRYAIEAAGFARTRTLFQFRIPPEQFAGPDPRAYYFDYAILAWR